MKSDESWNESFKIHIRVVEAVRWELFEFLSDAACD